MSKKTSSYYSQPGKPAFPGSYYQKAPTTEESALERILKAVQTADETRHDDDEYLAEILEKIQPEVSDIKARSELTGNTVDTIATALESDFLAVQKGMADFEKMHRSVLNRLEMVERGQNNLIQSQHKLDKAVGAQTAKMIGKLSTVEQEQKRIKKMLYNLQKQLDRIESAQNGKGNGGGKGHRNNP